MSRLDWNLYFMKIAGQVALRSTCDRKKVGAVIVKDKSILSTGYNGSISGMPHCEEVGHDMENGHCVATIHAEANAIIQAAKHGMAINGADLYITASPCWSCFKLIANSGIHRVFYGEFYRDERSLKVAKETGLELISLEDQIDKDA
jgi:dCMP deaminase